MQKKFLYGTHCVKGSRIRSYSGPHFSCIFRISPYSARMRENAGKMRDRITPNADTFCAVAPFRPKVEFITIDILLRVVEILLRVIEALLQTVRFS